MPHPSSNQYRRNVRPRSALVERTPASGRHALDEDALFTPIFHALAGRRPAPPDPVERFRRDPLTAPLPVVVPARRRPGGAHARIEPTGGRHHQRGPARFPH